MERLHGIKKAEKIKAITLFFLLGIFVLIIALVLNCNKRTESGTCYSKTDLITVSIFNKEGKSSLYVLDLEKDTKVELLKNKDVMVSGKINTSGDLLLYSDAIGNGNWEAYLFNLKNKKKFQLTEDKLGQFNLRFGNDKGTLFFAKVGGMSLPIPQIARIDTERKKAEILKVQGVNTSIKDFDTFNGNIIALTYSFEEDVERYKEKNEKNLSQPAPIAYDLLKMDYNGDNQKIITSINAVELDSIAYMPDTDYAIIGGKGIRGVDSSGFYKVNLNTGDVEGILLAKSLIDLNSIKDLSKPYIPCISSNGEYIYFAAIPVNAILEEYTDLMMYPNKLYKYSLRTKSLSEVFCIPDSVITKISITYVK